MLQVAPPYAVISAPAGKMKSIGSMPSGFPDNIRPIQPSQARASRTMPAVTAHTPLLDGSIRRERAATTAAAALAKKSAETRGTKRLAVGLANSAATWLPGMRLWFIQLARTKVVDAATIRRPSRVTVRRASPSSWR